MKKFKPIPGMLPCNSIHTIKETDFAYSLSEMASSSIERKNEGDAGLRK